MLRVTRSIFARFHVLSQMQLLLNSHFICLSHLQNFFYLQILHFKHFWIIYSFPFYQHILYQRMDFYGILCMYMIYFDHTAHSLFLSHQLYIFEASNLSSKSLSNLLCSVISSLQESQSQCFLSGIPTTQLPISQV